LGIKTDNADSTHKREVGARPITIFKHFKLKTRPAKSPRWFLDFAGNYYSCKGKPRISVNPKFVLEEDKYDWLNKLFSMKRDTFILLRSRENHFFINKSKNSED